MAKLQGYELSIRKIMQELLSPNATHILQADAREVFIGPQIAAIVIQKKKKKKKPRSRSPLKSEDTARGKKISSLFPDIMASISIIWFI